MGGRITLQQLRAAAVPMHVAEAADVHQNVEAQAVRRGKGARQFVMFAAVLRGQRDDLRDAPLAQRGHGIAHLAEAVVRVWVQQRRGQVDLQRHGFAWRRKNEIDMRRVCRHGLDGRIAHQLTCRLPQHRAAFTLKLTGSGVLYQRGTGAHLAQQMLAQVCAATLFFQQLERSGVLHIPCRARGSRA